MKKAYASVLKTWCDRLITLQIRDTGVKELDGGILCPACKVIHGRCPDAILPMMCMAKHTGEEKYLQAAKALFDWQTNMLTDEGSVYNDGNSEWRAITVFSAIGLCEALSHYGNLLDENTRARWQERLGVMGEWLYQTLDEKYPTNINYPVSNAAAMALIGRYLAKEDYIARACRLAGYGMQHITEEGFLRGEGKPREMRTERGCYPIDIGYNVEESIPSLVKCALALEDEEMISHLIDVLHKQLHYLLPDGGWNNSFGSRNNKWTYWGSRTTDGCQGAYALLGNRDPVLAEAARRNTELLARCTHDGLLYGGPEYFENGELPCVHHTFCHANALAVALENEGDEEMPRVALPMDADDLEIAHDRDVDTWRITVGPWRATVTGYDYDISAGHATGGTLCLLWHRKTGPVLLSSVLDYWLVEAHNMQLSLNRKRHRPLTPRVECVIDGVRYAQCYDTHASIQAVPEGNGVCVEVAASLVTLRQQPLREGTFVSLKYHIQPEYVAIEGRVYGGHASEARMILPVIADQAQVRVKPDCAPPERIFFLTGGFDAREFIIEPDAAGCLSARLCVE